MTDISNMEELSLSGEADLLQKLFPQLPDDYFADKQDYISKRMPTYDIPVYICKKALGGGEDDGGGKLPAVEVGIKLSF